MMKLLSLPMLVLLYLLPVTTADPIDNVADLIKQGNVHELSKLFANNIEITLLTDENVYSRIQAELVLQKFFTQNKPRTVKLLHRVNSSANYRFGVLLVNTDKGNYRVACTLNQIDGALSIIELRIETEKVK